MKKFLNEFAHNPQNCLVKLVEEKKISYAFYGYALGIISLYFSIKLITGNPASIASFFFIFMFWLLLNIIFNLVLAAISNLFLEITGERSKAFGIFILLGVSQMSLTLLIPWGLIVKTTPQILFLTPIIFLAVLVLQVYFVLTAMAKVYKTPRTSSLLAFIGTFAFPFFFAFCLMFLLMGWFITLIV